MIPRDIIDKAVHAAGENWVLTFEWEHDRLHAQVHAALEAVAAELYDEGYEYGRGDGECMSYTRPRERPYRASETA